VVVTVRGLREIGDQIDMNLSEWLDRDHVADPGDRRDSVGSFAELAGVALFTVVLYVSGNTRPPVGEANGLQHAVRAGVSKSLVIIAESEWDQGHGEGNGWGAAFVVSAVHAQGTVCAFQGRGLCGLCRLVIFGRGNVSGGGWGYYGSLSARGIAQGLANGRVGRREVLVPSVIAQICSDLVSGLDTGLGEEHLRVDIPSGHLGVTGMRAAEGVEFLQNVIELGVLCLESEHVFF
jgi:hypothetical protein